MAMDKKLFYRVSPSDWYKTYPFLFEIEAQPAGAKKEEKKPSGLLNSAIATIVNNAASTGVSEFQNLKFFLPIPPQHLSVQSIPTTEATATIGGVVEETTYPVFHMINLSGTTGMSVGNAGQSVSEDGVVTLTQYQRKSFEDLTMTGNLIGRTTLAATNVLDRSANLLSLTPEVTLPFFRFGSAVETPDSSGGQFGEGTNGPLTELESLPPVAKKSLGDRLKDSVTSQFSSATNPPTMYSNGFAWDHGLRQFFMIYQREKSKNPLGTKLFFTDVKSNTRYRCIPRGLQFTRSSASPYITIYNIVLKAWDLKGADETGTKFGAADRFKGDLSEVYAVNMTSIISRITKMWVITSAKNGAGLVDYALGDTQSAIKGSFFG